MITVATTARPGLRSAAAQPGGGTGRIRRVAARIGRGVTNLVLAAVVLLFLGLAVGPHVLGYRTMTMLTGSMAPHINPGDVVVAAPKPVSDLRVGDVLVYHIPVDDHRVVSHRVTHIERHTGGTVDVRTKGDANPAADPWTAAITDPSVWTIRGVIPHLGDAIRALRSPHLRPVFLYAGPALLVLLVLTRIWSGPARGSQDPEIADELLQTLREDLGDDATLARLLHSWSSLAERRVSELRVALEDLDGHRAMDRALSLSTSSALLGGTALAEASSAVRELVAAGDFATARCRMPSVQALAQATARALTKRAGELG